MDEGGWGRLVTVGYKVAIILSICLGLGYLDSVAKDTKPENDIKVDGRRNSAFEIPC